MVSEKFDDINSELYEILKYKTFVIAFVLYHPPLEVFNRIISLLHYNFEVFVFDNTPKETQKFLQEFKLNTNTKFRYFSCGHNIGLSTPLSILLSTSYYSGGSYLLYFDQDTNFDDNTISFVSNFLNNNSDLFKFYSMISLYKNRNLSFSKRIIQDHTHVILSGSLFNLSVIENLGWFKGPYFVDGVDYKLCLDSLNSGYKVGTFIENPGFDHDSFQDNYINIKIFNKNLSLKYYNSSRIIGVCNSHLRLILESFLTFQFLFFFRTVKLLLVFLLKQFFIRIINFAK